MADFDYDLFVIGAGSGGVRASRVAAQLGARVAVAESRYLGGTCVNVGCVPKKLFMYGAQFSEEFAAAPGFGWQLGEVGFDWPTLRDNKNREIERLNSVYGNLLTNAGVELHRGHARLIDAQQVEVDGKSFSCRYILIAAGSWPFVPDLPGAEHAITSNEVFYLPELPKRVAVVGAGYIALEFASIFNGLGVITHLLHRGPRLLRHFDEDVAQHIQSEMSAKGVQLHLETEVRSITRDQQGLKLHLSDDSLCRVDQVMFATGRRPMTDALGLENTRVRCDERGVVQVNRQNRTDEHSIYAIGDITGGPELTPVALAEGTALAQHLFGNGKGIVDYRNVPTAVFTQPNVATVGLSESAAREVCTNVRVYETDFRHIKHTLSGLTERTYMKLVVDGDSDRVLGCHMVGHEAGEIIQGLAVAMHAGATKADFDSTLGIHPTAAEEFVTMRQVSRE
ncbi:glutathione-disulfide reductase [Gilvimarinus sp. F26214L]|uniref:glutathione-disulfide reductase n=1 Tax=Gilvimarinus sp. DZF01 TaxID=3461371 RepID=UPI0040459554